MKEDERKPIAPTLRNMEVNDVEEWPLERIDTVTMTVGRFRCKRSDYEIGWYTRLSDAIGM